jgi:hypothetical protein
MSVDLHIKSLLNRDQPRQGSAQPTRTKTLELEWSGCDRGKGIFLAEDQQPTLVSDVALDKLQLDKICKNALNFVKIHFRGLS